MINYIVCLLPRPLTRRLRLVSMIVVICITLLDIYYCIFALALIHFISYGKVWDIDNILHVLHPIDSHELKVDKVCLRIWPNVIIKHKT